MKQGKSDLKNERTSLINGIMFLDTSSINDKEDCPSWDRSPVTDSHFLFKQIKHSHL